ncbi:type 1 glutamine amidotransferase [Paracoccus sp. SCSIO 75233]|uniref:type 1 glutamine amidotransferase n=1 Tax=Paracoccus sp. SCSIO 75233 TaxID=3017782 RepID=UPI0022F1125B|nr:type 1 glutamine amidotransferase [Paracoccus sp. SCSIO 75233]WBU53893.1 type 1 glutamine amidotransferase [Paracoccus sp. SCSIO 75233]
MQIGILQTGRSPEDLTQKIGDYPDMFVKLLDGRGFAFRNYYVEGMEFPDSVHNADGWLITGSRHGAYEPHDWIPPLEEFIRAAYDAAVPTVGICFGHQIIAQALGGKVEKFPGGWSIGAQQYQFGDETLTLNAWHQDQVTERPPTAEVAGRSGFCENAALIYPGRAFTVQAHPEFSDTVVEGLLDTRARGVVPEALQDKARASLGGKRDSKILADRIEAFFRDNAADQQGAA